jgi:hypothetical protein
VKRIVKNIFKQKIFKIQKKKQKRKATIERGAKVIGIHEENTVEKYKKPQHIVGTK